MTDPDIVIVGAGIGGSALAATMARAGYQVALLEKTTKHVDRMMGEWVAPWGAKELQKLGLLDPLLAAGGYHMEEVISIDEGMNREEALASARPVAGVMGMPGPLCIGHPIMCNVLNTKAVSAGATLIRGVTQIDIVPGRKPSVS